MVASAGRLMPRRVRTMRLAPTWSAPVLPAETKASPLPSLSIFRPTTMEESFFVRMALAGSSHISMASVQFTSSMPSREMLLSAAVLRTRASSPTPMSWTPYSFTAAAAPSSTAKGALSPPIISTMIFIGFLPSWGITSQSRSARQLPYRGEPLAKRLGFTKCQSLPSLGEVARRRRDGEVVHFTEKFPPATAGSWPRPVRPRPCNAGACRGGAGPPAAGAGCPCSRPWAGSACSRW